MFISAVLAVLIKRAPGANLWFVFVLAVATAIVGGIGIHRWIEMPLIECVKRWLKRRAAAPRPERC
jgi:peptidoglycan/LPS O-acetylase OafA/YrhL